MFLLFYYLINFLLDSSSHGGFGFTGSNAIPLSSSSQTSSLTSSYSTDLYPSPSPSSSISPSYSSSSSSYSSSSSSVLQSYSDAMPWGEGGKGILLIY
jgi:hypothetical protein